LQLAGYTFSKMPAAAVGGTAATVATLACRGFSLSLQPTTLSLLPGVQQAAQLSAYGVNGFNQPISGTISGLLSGVTVSSSTFNLDSERNFNCLLHGGCRRVFGDDHMYG